MTAYIQEASGAHTLLGEKTDFNPPNRQLALVELYNCVDDLIKLESADYSANDHMVLENRAQHALNIFCDADGIQDNETGYLKRIQFAQALDARIIRGDDLHAYGSELQIDEFIANEQRLSTELPSITNEYINRLFQNREINPIIIGSLPESAAQDLQSISEDDYQQTESEIIQVEPKTGFNPLRSIKKAAAKMKGRFVQKSAHQPELHDNEQNTKKRRGKITVAVGVIAAAATIAGSSLFLNKSNDSTSETESNKRTLETTSIPNNTSTQAPISTSTVIEQPAISQAQIPQEIIPGDSILPTPPIELAPAASEEAITIKQDQNVWDSLEELGTGSRKADKNVVLQREIARLLPEIAQDSGNIDLGQINPGTRIIISAENAAKLRAAGVGSLG